MSLPRTTITFYATQIINPLLTAAYNNKKFRFWVWPIVKSLCSSSVESRLQRPIPSSDLANKLSRILNYDVF